MKYDMEVVIDLPVKEVNALLADTGLLFDWMPTLTAYKRISGTSGAPGSVAELTHKLGKREITITETVTVNDYPHRYSAEYTAPGCVNIVENELHELGPSKTKWIMRNEFKCSGIMWLMAKLRPSGFKNQTRQHLDTFKEFAESRAAGGD